MLTTKPSNTGNRCTNACSLQHSLVDILIDIIQHNIFYLIQIYGLKILLKHMVGVCLITGKSEINIIHRKLLSLSRQINCISKVFCCLLFWLPLTGMVHLQRGTVGFHLYTDGASLDRFPAGEWTLQPQPYKPLYAVHARNGIRWIKGKKSMDWHLPQMSQPVGDK